MNWLQRSTAPGVTMATDFSTDAQVTPYRHGTLESTRKLTTRHMDDGVPCLKIATPADKADDQPQAWHRRLNDAWTKDNDGFGTTPFYIQFGFKIPPSRLIKWAPGAAGWKIAIIANSLMNHTWFSSNNMSHVIQDTSYRGYPTMYRHTNVNPNGTPLEGAIPGVSVGNDLNKSPGWDRGPTFTNYLDRYCCHSNKRGCPLWTVDVWLWFYIRLHTRIFGGTAGNELDMWWALPGDTSWTQLLKQRNYMVGSSIPWPNGFNDIGFTTFETDRNGPGADTYALYRELIVSTQEIAIPADAPVIPTEDNYAVVKGTRYKLLEEIIIPLPPPPVDCVLSPWMMTSFTPWSPAICPASGQQWRDETWERFILTLAKNGGAACGPLIEQRTVSQTCTYAPPPVDCVPSEWSMESATLWSPEPCPASGEQTRTESWVRTVITPAANGGAECGLLTEQRTSTQSCVYVPPIEPASTPVVDGKVTPLFDVSGNVPESWWAGMPKDEWLEVLNTKPTNLIPLLPAGFKDYGSFAGFFTAWTGAAFDAETFRLWLMGGGHGDSSNNGLGEFDFRTMKWRWAVPPTIITAEDLAHSKAAWGTAWTSHTMGYERNWVLKNGAPTAIHTYGGIAWSKQLQRVLVAHRANIFHLDPESGTFLQGIASSWISANSSVYDEATGKWFLFNVDANYYTNYRVFNAVTNTLSGKKDIAKIPGGVPKRLSAQLTPLLIGRKIVCVSDDVDYNSGINAWVMDADTEVVTDLPLINPPARVAPKQGHLHATTGGYSPDTGLIYAMQKPSGSGKVGRFTTIDRASGQCGEYIPAGTPPPFGKSDQPAPYTKCQIMKRASGTFLALFHLADANLRIVRLS